MRKRESGVGSRESEKKITVRQARRADAASILGLEAHFATDRMSARSVARLVRASSAVVLVAVPTPDSRLPTPVCGALVLLTRRNSRVARIYSVVVHPRARGQGLGRALVLSAETAARRRGCRAVSLEVRESSRAARALYRKLGYAETARLPRYYDDGASGLRLRKPLD